MKFHCLRSLNRARALGDLQCYGSVTYEIEWRPTAGSGAFHDERG